MIWAFAIEAKMRHHDLELDMLLRGIVMTRGENGATISEMRSDYYRIYGQQWPLQYKNTWQIISYLMGIDGLVMDKHEDGLCRLKLNAFFVEHEI